MTLRPGDRVDHFVIVSALGQGGMGQVYVARDERLHRNVALKIMQPNPEPGSEMATGGAARFLREARAAAGLEHPNVVTIFEVGTLEGTDMPFLAMELIKGRTLRSYVGDARVALEQRTKWMLDVARALGCAHENGLVHRDVKPENIMVRDDGVVKVLDFGLAKRAATPVSSTSSTQSQILPSLTAHGVAVGTPYYMAPEQMRREALDGRADQFSWGVVAYELLSGTPPWGNDVDALELVSKLLTSTPAPLDDVEPALPQHVAAAVMKTLAKPREERFASMAELVATIERKTDPLATTAPGTEPVPASIAALTPPLDAGASSVVVTPPTPRRARWVWPLAAGATLAVATGVVVLSRSWTTTPPPVVTAPSSSSSSSPAGGPRECSASSACVRAHDGKPFVCTAAGTCAAVETDRCRAHYEPGDLARDDTVWIGAMLPLTGPRAAEGKPSVNALELARRDFALARGSFGAGVAPVHPLALVSCDDTEHAEETARHLLDDVGAPAVIGFGSTAGTISLASTLFVPRGVLTVSTITLSPLLRGIPHAPTQPRLVWRTTYDNAGTAKAVAAVVAWLETKARSSHDLGAKETARVAVVRPKHASTAAFAEALFETLRFNGKSALDNGTDYREVAFDATKEKESYDDIAAQVARFDPAVVVYVANGEVLARIEAAIPASHRRRPRYVTTTALDGDAFAFLGTSKERRARVFGLTSVSTTIPNARLVVHYNESFPEPVTRTSAPNSVYDAFYLVGYAAYSLGDGAVRGEDLARAIARLVPPGTGIDVGPSGILPALSVLRRGEKIDLNGATGRMDFDLGTGEASVDFSVLCAGVDAKAAAADNLESGLVYDFARGALTGELVCP